MGGPYLGQAGLKCLESTLELSSSMMGPKETQHGAMYGHGPASWLPSRQSWDGTNSGSSHGRWQTLDDEGKEGKR